MTSLFFLGGLNLLSTNITMWRAGEGWKTQGTQGFSFGSNSSCLPLILVGVVMPLYILEFLSLFFVCVYFY